MFSSVADVINHYNKGEKEMKKAVFVHNYGWGEQNTDKEVFEFEDGTSEEIIQSAFEDWVWEKVGDQFGWHIEGEE